MKDAWGDVAGRNLEQFEIIDIKPKDELRKAWSDFIHTHHYQTAADFYESWIAKHPRRSCEVMWQQLMECRFVDENPIPPKLGWPELEKWLRPLLDAEAATDATDAPP